MRFEWDADKAAANLKKHRVSFDEAVTASMIRLLQPSAILITRTRRIALLRSGTRRVSGFW